MPKARKPENIGLPNRWTFQHGAYYYRVPTGSEHLWNGKKMYRLGSSLETAGAAFRDIKKEGVAPVPIKEATNNFRFTSAAWHKIGYSEACGIPLSILQSIYTSSRSSAIKRGLDFSLHQKDIIEIANKADGKCVLTGIRWDFLTTSKSRRPWMPSLDRIDSNNGYVTNNIRMVCLAVNTALSDFGDAALRRIASGFIQNCDTNQIL